MFLLAAGRAVDLLFQRLVARVGARPRQSETLHHRSHHRRRDPNRRNLAHLTHRHPLGWRSSPPSDSPKEATLRRCEQRPIHPIVVDDFVSERGGHHLLTPPQGARVGVASPQRAETPRRLMGSTGHAPIEGCGAKVYAKGLCGKHYMRALRHGGDLRSATRGQDAGPGAELMPRALNR